MGNGEIKEGDVILDNLCKSTKVLRKYEPTKQNKFKLKITSDESGESEEFIGGAEHLWVIYLKHPSGEVEGPLTVSTEELKDMKRTELTKPKDERILLKIKKG